MLPHLFHENENLWEEAPPPAEANEPLVWHAKNNPNHIIRLQVNPHKPFQSIETVLRKESFSNHTCLTLTGMVLKVDLDFPTESLSKVGNLKISTERHPTDKVELEFHRQLIRKCTNLKQLCLSGIDRCSPGYFDVLPKVEQLSLFGQRICLRGLADLSVSFPNITTLFIYGNLCPFKCCGRSTSLLPGPWARSVYTLRLLVDDLRLMRRPLVHQFYNSAVKEFILPIRRGKSEEYAPMCTNLRRAGIRLHVIGKHEPSFLDVVKPAKVEYDTINAQIVREAFALLRRGYYICFNKNLLERFARESAMARADVEMLQSLSRNILLARYWLVRLVRFWMRGDHPLNSDLLRYLKQFLM
jgi:hypothetical protein